MDDLTVEFEIFQGELKSFLLRMTASVQDAEDIVQDTYIKARSKINSFRGESSVKTWVFSIASNLARDLLRSKKRWPETVTDICREETLGNRQFFQEALQIRETSPQGTYCFLFYLCFQITAFGTTSGAVAQGSLWLQGQGDRPDHRPDGCHGEILPARWSQ
jgi:RNA polymerase sigma-70 factor (ECF subfamily)